MGSVILELDGGRSRVIKTRLAHEWDGGEVRIELDGERSRQIAVEDAEDGRVGGSMSILSNLG